MEIKRKDRVLKQLQALFPGKVKDVKNATRGFIMKINPSDVRNAVPKDALACPIAIAGKKYGIAAVATRTVLYIVKKSGIALRYLHSSKAKVNLAPFDRVGPSGFEPGSNRMKTMGMRRSIPIFS